MKTFKSLGGKETASIIDANILCIAPGQLKKTYKLIMAVARGKDIVSTEWMEDVHRQGSFTAVEDFLPRDGSRERSWKFNLKEAINRGKKGLSQLLTGTTIYFTKQLKAELGDLERELAQIATIVGANVKGRLPTVKDKNKLKDEDVMVLGVLADPQSDFIARLGLTLFNKDVLTMAVLRGKVERQSEEFLIGAGIKDED